MKIIERYVFGSFLSSFLLAFLVLSFVLTISLLVNIVDLIMDGVPMSLVGEFSMVSLPETLQWSMPIALLVSSILVFSRLSADSEIAAMRACGINLLSVVRWPVLFGVLCVVLGLVIWKKQKIDLIHDYQHRNVREEDKPAYCRQMGISIIFIGVAIGLDGVANLFSWETFGYLSLAVGIIGGLVIMHKAQKQYNGGWFS